jgi:hypothetical protein
VEDGAFASYVAVGLPPTPASDRKENERGSGIKAGQDQVTLLAGVDKLRREQRNLSRKVSACVGLSSEGVYHKSIVTEIFVPRGVPGETTKSCRARARRNNQTKMQTKLCERRCERWSGCGRGC